VWFKTLKALELQKFVDLKIDILALWDFSTHRVEVPFREHFQNISTAPIITHRGLKGL
jgi:hypothetical protein